LQRLPLLQTPPNGATPANIPARGIHGLTIMARRALSPSTPARQKARALVGSGGLTAQRGQASGVSCPECREAPSQGCPMWHPCLRPLSRFTTEIRHNLRHNLRRTAGVRLGEPFGRPSADRLGEACLERVHGPLRLDDSSYTAPPSIPSSVPNSSTRHIYTSTGEAPAHRSHHQAVPMMSQPQ